MRKTDISQKLYDEAKELFPGGVNSPVRAFKSVYGPPVFIKNGHGPRFYDVDDNEYIDFCCSWGPLIHGHNNAHIKDAVIATIENGMSFGTPTEHGNLLGQLIIDNHRYIDKVRFVSSGTEAVMSAIRLARGYTGRDKIIKFDGCYHGHVDSLLVKAGSGLATFGVSTSAGVPESFAQETIIIELDDLDILESTLKAHAHETACIIMEPVPANNGLLIQSKEYLQGVRDLCDRYDVLLIFDEVISGFRVGYEGAAGLYGIAPDIITFGKIIGGGLPVGAFGGRADIMGHISPDGPVYQAGTLSANPVAMTAGYASLSLCLADGFYEDQERRTKHLVDQLNAHAKKNNYTLRVEQMGSIFWLNFSDQHISRSSQIDAAGMELFKKMHKYLLDRGVYLGPSGYEVGFVSAAHDESTLDQAAALIIEAMDHTMA